MLKRLRERLTRLLLVPRIRFYLCKIRWKLLKKNIRFFEQPSAGVGQDVVKYNLTALDSDAAFGCGARMDILMYPLAALVYPAPNAIKLLIIGPRTEDDIFLAKALGFSNVRGLDLFSYSPLIDVGDMHNLPYADGEFDAVVLGWVLAYSGEQAKAIEQCKRVLKKDGHLAIGWEWVPEPSDPTGINGTDEMISLMDMPVVFVKDPSTKTNHHKSVIFINRH